MCNDGGKDVHRERKRSEDERDREKAAAKFRLRSSPTELCKFAPGVWTVEGSLEALSSIPLLSFSFPVRMVIVALGPSTEKDGLLVYSPFPPRKIPLEAIRKLGPVKFVVVPNNFHWLWATLFVEAFPEAALYSSPGLSVRFPGKARGFGTPLKTDTIPKDVFGKAVEWRHVPGIKALEEIVMIHKPSKTLIVTDLAFNFRRDKDKELRARLQEARGSLISSRSASDTKAKSRATAERSPRDVYEDPLNRLTPQFPISIYLTLAGGYCECSLTQTFRLLFDDVPALHSALQSMVDDWDFKHMIMAHGCCIKDDGKAKFEQGTLAFVRAARERQESKKGLALFAVAAAVVGAAVAGGAYLVLKKDAK